MSIHMVHGPLSSIGAQAILGVHMSCLHIVTTHTLTKHTTHKPYPCYAIQYNTPNTDFLKQLLTYIHTYLHAIHTPNPATNIETPLAILILLSLSAPAHRIQDPKYPRYHQPSPSPITIHGQTQPSIPYHSAHTRKKKRKKRKQTRNTQGYNW